MGVIKLGLMLGTKYLATLHSAMEFHSHAELLAIREGKSI